MTYLEGGGWGFTANQTQMPAAIRIAAAVTQRPARRTCVRRGSGRGAAAAAFFSKRRLAASTAGGGGSARHCSSRRTSFCNNLPHSGHARAWSSTSEGAVGNAAGGSACSSPAWERLQSIVVNYEAPCHFAIT